MVKRIDDLGTLIVFRRWSSADWCRHQTGG
jgi:hypothetical protein